MPTTRTVNIRVVLLAAAALILIFPVYWMIVTAVTPTAELFSPKFSIFPAGRDPSSAGFQELTGEQPAVRWILNSMIITGGTTLISTFISVLAGYSLSRFAGPAHRAMGMILLLSRMLPGTLLVIPLYITFLRLGLINSLWALVIVNTAFVVPFNAWMLKVFFDGIPRELEEAALVDGCGRLRALCLIILPLSKAGLTTSMTFAAVIAWSDFLFARTLLTDRQQWPVTVGLASFLGDYSTNWNAIMALGLLSVAPLVILFIFTERYLISGLTAGSVKG